MAKLYPLRRTSTLALRQGKAALLRRLAVPPDLLRASFVERFTNCGKLNCRCAAGHRHGAFDFELLNLGPRHFRKWLLKTPTFQQAAPAGVAAYPAHWEGLEELSQLNLVLLRRGEPLHAAPPWTASASAGITWPRSSTCRPACGPRAPTAPRRTFPIRPWS